jgi:hypothetical protein
VFKNPDELKNVRDAIHLAEEELKELEAEYGTRSG